MAKDQFSNDLASEADVAPVEDATPVDPPAEAPPEEAPPVEAPVDPEEYKGPVNPVPADGSDNTSEPALREVPPEDDPLAAKASDFPTVVVRLDPNFDRGDGVVRIVGAHEDIVFEAGETEVEVQNVPADVVANSPAVDVVSVNGVDVVPAEVSA